MTTSTAEELIAQVEITRRQRRSRIIWSFVGIGVLMTTLIWTTDVPAWWNEVSPYVYLQWLLMTVVCLIFQGSAVKNEEILLRQLKELQQ